MWWPNAPHGRVTQDLSNPELTTQDYSVYISILYREKSHFLSF